MPLKLFCAEHLQPQLGLEWFLATETGRSPLCIAAFVSCFNANHLNHVFLLTRRAIWIMNDAQRLFDESNFTIVATDVVGRSLARNLVLPFADRKSFLWTLRVGGKREATRNDSEPYQKCLFHLKFSYENVIDPSL